MKPNQFLQGDALEALKTLPDESIQMCVTSPPYWGLRDYGVDGQLGLEKTPEEYVQKLTEIFREVRRVLKDDGTLWLNLGDSYAGSGRGNNPNGKQGTNKGTTFEPENSGYVPIGLKAKDLVGIPWRVAFALQADGWYLRQDIIWAKPNPMPESVTDRCTKSHEYIFLLSKSAKYYFDNEAIKEPATSGEQPRNRPNGLSAEEGKQLGVYRPNCGVSETRNKRSVWTVTTKPYAEAHFATFPKDLISPCIKAGCPEGEIVLDPFMGSGTTAEVSQLLSRNWIGIELNEEYIELAKLRIRQQSLLMF